MTPKQRLDTLFSIWSYPATGGEAGIERACRISSENVRVGTPTFPSPGV